MNPSILLPSFLHRKPLKLKVLRKLNQGWQKVSNRRGALNNVVLKKWVGGEEGGFINSSSKQVPP